MAVAMTVLWSVLLAVQIVGVERQVPSTMPLAARTQNLEIMIGLSERKIYESIRVVWCKKV
jgi:hypothetical protein